jgi:hypothetical protein
MRTPCSVTESKYPSSPSRESAASTNVTPLPTVSEPMGRANSGLEFFRVNVPAAGDAETGFGMIPA